jgi:hypothetical protein
MTQSDSDGLPTMGDEAEFILADLAHNIRKTSEAAWRKEADKIAKLPGSPERSNHSTMKDFHNYVNYVSTPR